MKVSLAVVVVVFLTFMAHHCCMNRGNTAPPLPFYSFVLWLQLVWLSQKHLLSQFHFTSCKQKKTPIKQGVRTEGSEDVMVHGVDHNNMLPADSR